MPAFADIAAGLAVHVLKALNKTSDNSTSAFAQCQNCQQPKTCLNANLVHRLLLGALVFEARCLPAIRLLALLAKSCWEKYITNSSIYRSKSTLPGL